MLGPSEENPRKRSMTEAEDGVNVRDTRFRRNRDFNRGLPPTDSPPGTRALFRRSQHAHLGDVAYERFARGRTRRASSRSSLHRAAAQQSHIDSGDPVPGTKISRYDVRDACSLPPRFGSSAWRVWTS